MTAALDLHKLLMELYTVISTIREEQVSSRMGFGHTDAERQQRATAYAAEIQRQAYRIDDLLDRIAEEQKYKTRTEDYPWPPPHDIGGEDGAA